MNSLGCRLPTFVMILLALSASPALATQWLPAGINGSNPYATSFGFSDGAGNFVGGGGFKVDLNGTVLWNRGYSPVYSAAPDRAGGVVLVQNTNGAIRVNSAGVTEIAKVVMAD